MEIISPPEETNELADIMGRLRKEFATRGSLILPTPLGPIAVDHLTNIKGWTYEFTPLGFPGIEPPITIGGVPVVLADFTDEKGWLLSYFAVFRSPFGALNYFSDSHNFATTPFLLNATGFNVPTDIAVYNNVYNPVSPLGPMYGVAFRPAYPNPYERLLRIELTLPVGSPIAASTVFSAGVSRIKIVDEATFIRSIKKFTAEQMIGTRLDRFP